MKTQNVLKNGSLLILGLFITSMVWSNNMITAGNDQETVTETSVITETGIHMNSIEPGNEHSAIVMVNTANPSGGTFYNFPDPFTNSTSVVYEITQPTHVKLMIYQGQTLVTILVDEYKVAGRYTVELDTRGLPAGEYIGFLVTNYGTFLESMTKKANIAHGSGEDDDQ